MVINVYLSIPPPFSDDEYPEFQGVKRSLFNNIAGKEIFDVIVDEDDLDALLIRVPQINVMDSFQQNGFRVGLKVNVDNTDPEIPVVTINGTHKHTPNAALVNGLKDKINYDAEGNQVGVTPRVLVDDDVHHWFGWSKRDFIN